MDRDERLVGRVIAIEYDFSDQDMGDALLGSGVRPRRIPGRRQIAGERYQRGTVDLGAPCRDGIMPGDASLNMGHPLQRRVPAGLELARDQTLSRIDELVAAAGQGGLITRFLKLATQRLPDVVVGLHRLLGGLDGGVNCVFGNRLDDLRRDGAIDPDAADADA